MFGPTEFIAQLVVQGYAADLSECVADGIDVMAGVAIVWSELLVTTAGQTLVLEALGPCIGAIVGGTTVEYTYRDRSNRTTYVEKMEHCPNGRYFYFGFSRHTTILGAEVNRNWDSGGIWRVTSLTTGSTIEWTSDDGSLTSLPIMPTGAIGFPDGYSRQVLPFTESC